MSRIRRAALATAPLLVGLTVCLGLAGAIAARVDAATVLRLGLEDLVARCDLALEARVTSCSASIDATGRIGTDYALTVERTFAGKPALQRTIRLPGGVLPDGRGLVLPGMPALAVGDTAILFLSVENARGERVPIGLAQGRLCVRVDADGTRSLVSDLSGLDLVDASGLPLPHPVAGPVTLPYASTIERIRAACARRAEKAPVRDARAERAPRR